MTVGAVLTVALGLLRGDASRPRRIVIPALVWIVVYLIVGLIDAPAHKPSPAMAPEAGADEILDSQDPDYLRNDLDESDHRER